MDVILGLFILVEKQSDYQSSGAAFLSSPDRRYPFGVFSDPAPPRFYIRGAMILLKNASPQSGRATTELLLLPTDPASVEDRIEPLHGNFERRRSRRPGARGRVGGET
jgi:hypothetical protein